MKAPRFFICKHCKNIITMVEDKGVPVVCCGEKIAWIYLETSQGGQIKYLDHTGAPEAVFALAEGEQAVAAYEYCNLHGLWKAEI